VPSVSSVSMLGDGGALFPFMTQVYALSKNLEGLCLFSNPHNFTAMLRRLATNGAVVPRARFCSQAAGDFIVSPSGLRFRNTFVPESGERVDDGHSVSVHFTGRLEGWNGDVFDTSLDETLAGNQPEFDGASRTELKGWDRGIPVQFTVGAGEVIEGWDEGVLGMRIGGKRELIVPAELGYGDKGSGKVPPDAELYFEVELLDASSENSSAGGGSLWSSIFGGGDKA
jgi:hypothetical protein